MANHRFLMTRDGVRIAYAEHGTGPPLIYVRGWLSHLDVLWDRPGFRVFIESLSTHYRVIRYDMRGNGLSDREGVRISLSTLVDELEDLVEHLGLDRFVLWGASFGGPTAITYATRHPDKVESLILDGTYARGAAIAPRMRRWLIVLALRFFPEMAFLLLSNATNPNPQRSAQRTLELGSQMVNPKMGAKLYRLAFSTDVSKILCEVKSPTLVLHALGSRSIPVRLGQELSARILNAEFVGIKSEGQNSFEGDLSQLMQIVNGFLGTNIVVDSPEAEMTATAPDIDLPVPDEPFVFISYAHRDDTEVRKAVKMMEARGFTVWIDAGITPGSEWRDQIARAVQSCAAFILFTSEHSLISRHCLQETNFAVDENRPILVVYLGDVKLPPSLRMPLSTLQAIQKYNLDEENFEKRLVLGLRNLMPRIADQTR